MRSARVAAALVLCAVPAFAQTPARPLNWDSLAAETVRNLSAYLAINTTNPPGHEVLAARYLQHLLQGEGIEAQILDTAELGAGRANLYARLRGSGAKRAIALVNHLDVVPATPQFWSVDPFSGVIRDGYVWGRGALDMKGEGMVQLMAMIALKRSGVRLSRDIVFIGNADEELGGTGAETFVRRHPDLLQDVAFLMTEGGGNAVENGVLEYYGVGVAEKRTFWQRLTVYGTPSHGSRPTKLNPVPRLVDALSRLAHYETPLHVTPGVAKYFRDIAPQFTGPQRAWLADVGTALVDSTARAWITENVYWNAILRNTISLTVLNASNKTNVIPAEATAELDIRLLPDQDTAQVRAELVRAVHDTAVHWETILPPRAPFESPIDTDLFRAIERAARERDPGARVTTPMLTGATDRPTYRALGIVTYGFDPFKVERVESQRGVHGNDERVSVPTVGFGVHYLYDVLRYAQ
jgi:acetylornithine deacetylase/succinyl-diaminopimelate desuccinylase-like protein